MDKLFLHNLIVETLQAIGLYSPEACDLLMGTAAQESAFGRYRRQLGNGPALGIFQMEPFTHDDCWNTFLNYKPQLGQLIIQVSGVGAPCAAYLETNDVYAICMARIKYYRDPQPVPLSVPEQAQYWKRVYNSYMGAGTVEEYMHNYQLYVL